MEDSWKNGLPDRLDKVRSLSSINRKSLQMLEEASEQALADGFTPEQIENAKLPDYPPTEADPEWMKGWSQAAAGQTPDTNNTKQRQGYMAWLSRNA